MSQTYLAWATGYTLKHINRVIQGKARININLALALEEELGTPARFWMVRQVDYDLALARHVQSHSEPA